MSNLVEMIEREQMTREVPDFSPGDTVIVHVKVKEGARERLQAFERTFQTYSPAVNDIAVKRRGDVRRAKLYYLRDRRGNAAKIREKV